MTSHDPIPQDVPSQPTSRARRHLRSVPPARAARDRRPATITLRDETDLLALIPYTFGFHPHDSLVMMLLGDAGRPMFARVDMPTSADEADAACAELVHAAVVNGGRRAVLVAYTDHGAAALLAAEQAEDELTTAGFEVLLALRTDGRRWWRVLPAAGAEEGVPYDLSTHAITASGVLEGRVTHRTRDQLAQSLLPTDPDRLEAVASAHAALPRLPEDHSRLKEEACWLDGWVALHTAADPSQEQASGARHVPPDELARVVRALGERQLRDVAWAAMDRRDAEAHVRLWTDVVVQCPLDLLAAPAGLLAFAAWLSGHGALAWCAVDRSLQSDPDHTMAHLVGQALDGAVPPSTWHPVDRRSLPLLSR